ncbi:MAG: fructosamine kinase family protein [Alphaproteobacteria bacterium]|nr:fructosamine kinase family protein [Alphaproteobacteria bacterium]
MSNPNLRIESALGARVVSTRPLAGGCVAKVARFELSDGRSVVVKQGGDGLAAEGWMLSFLKGKLPVPDVLLAEPDLLVMTCLEAESNGMDESAETHCAELVATLHDFTAPEFGLERDTPIGGLAQPNQPCERWLDFFRDQRLLHMARLAHQEGALPGAMLGRLERLAANLDHWIEEPRRPSLIHGDLWGGNILAASGRVCGFVDPAIYFAHPEIELAFGTLFGTFGPTFFRRYGEIRSISPDFFEIRRDLYNLYPLLVHVRLFGAGYLGQVERNLDRFDV